MRLDFKININELFDNKTINITEQKQKVYDDIGVVLAIILDHCSPSICQKYKDITNPYLLWTSLSKEFKEERPDVELLLEKYLNYSFQPGMTIGDHLVNLRNYEDQLLHAGEAVSTRIKKHIMLKNLPTEFLYIVSLCKMNKEYKLDQIREGLRNHELLIKNQ